MKIFIKAHKVSLLAICFLAIVLFLPVHDYLKYHVTYTICEVSYSNCKVYAKFEDMDSCEFYNEYSSLSCSMNEENNRECKTANNRSVVSYCSP